MKEKYIKINSNIEVEEFFELILKRNYNKLNQNQHILQSQTMAKDGVTYKGFTDHYMKKNISNLSEIVSLINMINDYKNGAKTSIYKS